MKSLLSGASAFFAAVVVVMTIWILSGVIYELNRPSKTKTETRTEPTVFVYSGPCVIWDTMHGDYWDGRGWWTLDMAVRMTDDDAVQWIENYRASEPYLDSTNSPVVVMLFADQKLRRAK